MNFMNFVYILLGIAVLGTIVFLVCTLLVLREALGCTKKRLKIEENILNILIK